MNINFTLEYWLDDGWYVGRLKEIPGVFSQGETLEELKANIIEAYKLVNEDSYHPIDNSQTIQINIAI